MYKEGKIQEAINLATPCVTSDIASDQWKAIRLITICHIQLGNKKEARKSGEKMLELKPTYVPSTVNDPTELIKLLNSIQVLPKLSVGLTTIVGYIFSKPQVINSHNGANYQKEYTNKGSWQFGLTVGYHINKNLSVHSGLIAIGKGYDISYTLDNIYSVEITERLAYLDIPLYLRYKSALSKKTHAFVNLGVYGGRLLGSNNDFILTKQIGGDSKEFSSLRISSEDRRNKYETGILSGIGLNRKIKSSTISLELNYYKGVNYNLTNTDTRYTNQDIFLDYFYWDDDLRLDNLAVSLSWILNLNYKVYKAND
jgi:hypothetical protein